MAVQLNAMQEELCAQTTWDFSDLSAVFVNCTLKRSPELSHTQGLVDISAEIMRRQGVTVDELRAVDHDIASGVWPDMTEHGWPSDEWPAIFEQVMAAAHPRAGTPIWLGEKSSVCTRVIERLYGNSQPAQRRRAVRLLRARRRLPRHRQRGRHQALRDERPLLAAAPRLRDPAAGRRRLDRRGRSRAVVPRPRLRRAGERLHEPQHHVHDVEPAAPGPAARSTPAACPAHGNQRVAWDAGCRFDFPNPEHR